MELLTILEIFHTSEIIQMPFPCHGSKLNFVTLQGLKNHLFCQNKVVFSLVLWVRLLKAHWGFNVHKLMYWIVNTFTRSVHLACGRSGFETRSGQTKVVKTGNDSTTAKRSATDVNVMVLWDHHYKWMHYATVNVARSKTVTAQWPRVPSIAQNLKPFTGSGDVSIWLKISWVGRKTTTNKTRE